MSTTTTMPQPLSRQQQPLPPKAKTLTILDCIEEKYSPDDDNGGHDFGFIVFVSNSPEAKKGM